MTETTNEPRKVEQLFSELMGARQDNFPKAGKIEAHAAPESRGVYVIYDPSGRVVHVGGTPRGKGGLAQRLENHLHSASTFTRKYPPMKSDGSKLRDGYTFRCLPVSNDRLRAFLEAYAIGRLCPAHIGLHQLSGIEDDGKALRHHSLSGAAF
jgi:hypothetical protein